MSLPHDAPSMAELVEAVREWLDSDVTSQTDGRLRFHARVASNMLAMVERELATGDDDERAHLTRLEQLGVDDDRQLADALRQRTLTADVELVRQLLRESVVDKVRVANPTYLDEADRRDGATDNRTG